ncbi:hypothetical protein ABZ912_20185 [Nonomuraea angiospora]|uniref:hypothetical protein n=1 Tax=Nonomuraea angiospora TaxID=46172 RepID=UPI0033FB72BD
MSKSIHALVPAQRPAEQPCPRGCHSDHAGELPGEWSHGVAIATIRTDDGGTVCVDRTQRDGEQPEVVVQDQDGNELRIPEYVAVAVGNAIAAAGISWAAVA